MIAGSGNRRRHWSGFTIAALRPTDPWLVLALAGCYGALTYPIYGLAVAHANDYADASEFVAVSGGLLLLYGAGTMVGPLAAGVAMIRLGPEALFLVTAASHVLMAGYAIFRTYRRARDPGERARGLPDGSGRADGHTPATAALDPRAEDATILDRQMRSGGQVAAPGFDPLAWRGPESGNARMSLSTERQFIPVSIAVLTVSDTRTLADDKSGDTLAQRIAEAGHRLADRKIVTDDVGEDPRHGRTWTDEPGDRCGHHHRRHRLHRPRCHAGGAGAPVRKAHGRLLGGFSPHLLREDRHVDDPEPRATGGVANATFIFVLPGSPGACRDAWDGILKAQFDYRHKPCNFVEIMPRLDEHLPRGAAKP